MDFGELREKRNKIESLKERIARLRSSVEFGSRPIAGATASDKDRLARKIAQLVDLEDRLFTETAEIEQSIREVEYSIERLPENMRRVVRLRDIDFNPWKKVSRKAHYSERHCKRLHADAIRILKSGPEMSLFK